MNNFMYIKNSSHAALGPLHFRLGESSIGGVDGFETLGLELDRFLDRVRANSVHVLFPLDKKGSLPCVCAIMRRIDAQEPGQLDHGNCASVPRKNSSDSRGCVRDEGAFFSPQDLFDEASVHKESLAA